MVTTPQPDLGPLSSVYDLLPWQRLLHFPDALEVFPHSRLSGSIFSIFYQTSKSSDGHWTTPILILSSILQRAWSKIWIQSHDIEIFCLHRWPPCFLGTLTPCHPHGRPQLWESGSSRTTPSMLWGERRLRPPTWQHWPSFSDQPRKTELLLFLSTCLKVRVKSYCSMVVNLESKSHPGHWGCLSPKLVGSVGSGCC